jgi:hypothetical protein
MSFGVMNAGCLMLGGRSQTAALQHPALAAKNYRSGFSQRQPYNSQEPCDLSQKALSLNGSSVRLTQRLEQKPENIMADGPG